MPIYEYRCRNCGKRFTQFLRSMSQTDVQACSHCGSNDAARLVSRVAVLKPFGESLNWLPSSETLTDFDENDPKSIAKWLKRIRKEAGADLGPYEADEDAMANAGIGPEDLADDSDT